MSKRMEEKSTTTNRVANELIRSEAAARDKKSAQLKALRLARDAAVAPPAEQPKRKRASAKRA